MKEVPKDVKHHFELRKNKNGIKIRFHTMIDNYMKERELWPHISPPTHEIYHFILYSDIPTYFKVLNKICKLLKNRKIILTCWFHNSKNMQLVINLLLHYIDDINEMFNIFRIAFSNRNFGSFQ